MSESSGILLSGIGQSLIQFADIQHDTKISSLEAEAQRQKEIRLQEMQVSRDAITDSFRLADLESSQERLRLAQKTSNLAREKFDYEKEQDLLAEYDWTNQNVYGHYTEEVDDPMNPGGTKKEQQWGIIGQRRVGINKKDPDDIRILNMDGTMTSGTTADVEVDLLEGIDADVLSKLKSDFRSVVGKNPTDEELALAYQTGVANGSIVNGKIVDESAAGAPSAADVLSPDASGTYPEFQELDASSAKSPFTAGSRIPVAPEPSVTAQTGYDPNQEWVPNVTDPIGPEDYVPKPTPADTITLDKRTKPTTRFPNLGTAVETTETASSDATANTGGQSVPELPPEPDKVVVEAEGMSEVFAYDAAKSKAFIEGLIKEMQTANISQEDIRKELLSILGGIPKEQANGDFAKAVANAYYEFTKGTN